jgi:hypothetical protein
MRTICPQIPQAAELVVPTAPVFKDRLQLEHARTTRLHLHRRAPRWKPVIPLRATAIVGPSRLQGFPEDTLRRAHGARYYKQIG